jgi:hypothetical protein
MGNLILLSLLFTSVVNTGVNFAAGVIVTGGKFTSGVITGVVDTGYKYLGELSKKKFKCR